MNLSSIVPSRTVKGPIRNGRDGHAALKDTLQVHGECHAGRVSTVAPAPYRRSAVIDEGQLVLQMSARSGKEEIVRLRSVSLDDSTISKTHNIETDTIESTSVRVRTRLNTHTHPGKLEWNRDWYVAESIGKQP